MNVLILLACGPHESDTGAPSAPVDTTCAWSFGRSSEWEVPSPFGAISLGDMYADGLSGQGFIDYTARLDWTGEGPPDLLLTYAEFEDPALPPGEWWVYLGEQARYARDPQVWDVPADALDPAARVFADLDGDGQGEVLVTAGADPALGVTAWDVYDAFSDVPRRLALPDDGGDYSSASSLQLPHGFLANLVGDARLDVVRQDDAAPVRTWSVYLGSATGFGPEPIAFALPQFAENPYGEVAWGCATGRVGRFELVDLEGDGVTELVQTSDCADPSIGSTHWAVYRNLQTGFARVPEELALPWPVLADEEAGCGAADLVDADGDGDLDLVVTARCDDASVGRSHLEVYPGSDASFGDAESWALPDDWPQDSQGLDWLKECDLPDDHGQTTFRRTALFPMRGGPLWALQFDACDDPNIGTAYWLASEASCD